MVLRRRGVHGLWLEPPRFPHSVARFWEDTKELRKKSCWPETKKMKFPNTFAAWDYGYC